MDPVPDVAWCALKYRTLGQTRFQTQKTENRRQGRVLRRHRSGIEGKALFGMWRDESILPFRGYREFGLLSFGRTGMHKLETSIIAGYRVGE
jgi:hypothetical protein